jgi:hypothetical protein
MSDGAVMTFSESLGVTDLRFVECGLDGGLEKIIEALKKAKNEN